MKELNEEVSRKLQLIREALTETLRDDQWERLKDLLPGRAGTVGVTAKNTSTMCRSCAVPLPGRYSLA